MTSPPVDLSVVVAIVPDAAVQSTLAAVQREAPAHSAEILLVRSRQLPLATPADARCRVIESDAQLVPELWGAGLAASTGRIVALTMAGCVPEPGWCNAMLTAFAADDRLAAVGGPIVPAASASILSRAVVFARYSAYLPPVSASESAEVPGDNGAYRRADIEASMQTYAVGGFWEVDVNRQLRGRGRRLRLLPDMQMQHEHTFGVRAFCRQRFEHGEIFGVGRAAHLSRARRVCRALAAPLTIALMTLRAGRHAARAAMTLAFLTALPLVVLFYACWVAGETRGLIRGRRR